MALTSKVFECLAALHAGYHFKGPAISLGVINVPFTVMQVTPLLANLQIPHVDVPRNERRNTTSQSLIKSGHTNTVHAETVLRLMGISPYTDIDFRPDDKPAIVANLNEPLPKMSANFLIDCGGLEHVSNLSVGIENIIKVLNVGGFAFHCNPINNLTNHGYFQFSPIFLQDIYRTNGYTILNRFIIAEDSGAFRGLVTPLCSPMGKLMFKNPEVNYWLATLVRKDENIPYVKWPTQGRYRDDYKMLVEAEEIQSYIH
jgi:hypothetical protein